MTLRTYSRLVAIVGRPNVGKSTLFNRIIKQRKSLVHDEPGVTRDRIFSRARHDDTDFYLCDTGGFEPTSKDNIKMQLVEQAELAIEEADVVIFVVDAREGLHPIDTDLVRRLRKAEKLFFVAVNKCDLPMHDALAEDFRKLGVDKLFPVSAEHNRGVSDLLDEVVAPLKKEPTLQNVENAIRFSLIGRPNVGKSSILNRLAGEVRSIVDDRPGTTRDTVDALIRYHGREIVMVDTAGIRRHSRMVDKLEKFSALRSLQALDDCHVAALIIDAKEGPTEGDVRVAGFAFEMRKPLIIVVNKWDLLEDKDSKSAQRYTEQLRIALRYIPYAPIVFVSALENLRVSKLLPMCVELFDEGEKRVKTSVVNNTLRSILLKHTPPLRKNRSRRIKFFYATQVTKQPPRFVVFCSEPDEIHFSYKRFVENEFRAAFGFEHIPISVFFRERKRVDLDQLLAPVKDKMKKDADLLDLAEEELVFESEDEAPEISFDDEDFSEE